MAITTYHLLSQTLISLLPFPTDRPPPPYYPLPLSRVCLPPRRSLPSQLLCSHPLLPLPCCAPLPLLVSLVAPRRRYPPLAASRRRLRLLPSPRRATRRPSPLLVAPRWTSCPDRYGAIGPTCRRAGTMSRQSCRAWVARRHAAPARYCTTKPSCLAMSCRTVPCWSRARAARLAIYSWACFSSPT
jgi:hypothetical protein